MQNNSLCSFFISTLIKRFVRVTQIIKYLKLLNESKNKVVAKSEYNKNNLPL